MRRVDTNLSSSVRKSFQKFSRFAGLTFMPELLSLSVYRQHLSFLGLLQVN
jgi:hypothetical protein